MGEIKIELKGNPEDMDRLYQHLSYHTKNISDAHIEKDFMLFSVTI
jgi:hypothetical protein